MFGVILIFAALVALIAHIVIRDRRARANARKPGAFQRSFIPHCPICGGDISGHVWRELFLFIDPSETEKAEIDRDVQAREWEAFAGQYRFDPLRDAFGYCMLECPSGGAGL